MNDSFYFGSGYSENDTLTLISIKNVNFLEKRHFSGKIILIGVCTKSEIQSNINKTITVEFDFFARKKDVDSNIVLIKSIKNVIYNNMVTDDSSIEIADDAYYPSLFVKGEKYPNTNKNIFIWKAVFLLNTL